MASNMERLQAAGIATKARPGGTRAGVIDELSEEEVAALISIKRRFDQRTEVQAQSADTEEPAQEFFALI